MFRRSFGAPTFGGFWRYWNPIFSYYLSYFCYRPLASKLSRSVAVILTFTASGGIHDVVASLFLWEVYLFFGPLFAFWGLLVVIEEALGLTYSRFPVWSPSLFYTFIIVDSSLLGQEIRTLII